MRERRPSEGIQTLTYCPAFISKCSLGIIVTWTGLLLPLPGSSLPTGYLKISPTVGFLLSLLRVKAPLRRSRSPTSAKEVRPNTPKAMYKYILGKNDDGRCNRAEMAMAAANIWCNLIKIS